MNRPSVMHLTFDMGIGGAEQVIRQLVTSESELGVSSSILCIDAPLGAMGVALRKAGHEVSALGRRPGLDWSLVREIRQRLRRARIDILHCHQYTPWVYGFLAAQALPVRVVFTEHGRFYPDQRHLKRWLPNIAMSRLSDRITAISAATAEALARYEFIPRAAIEVVYNGIRPLEVDPADLALARRELGLAPETRVIGTVARLDPIKNHRLLIDAFAAVAAGRDDLALLIVGDGPEREALRAQADRLGVGQRVLLPGFRDDPAPLFGLMDVYVLPSLSEGTSMTLLEAMSMALPCVVTDVGGNPEIVQDGVSGRVVPSDDRGALAAALAELLDDRPMATAMGDAGRQRFDAHFDLGRMVAAYRTLYRSLVAVS